jgi:hypothetical protein
MAFLACLFGGFEDVEPEAVTVDAIRGLRPLEKVDLMALSVHNLQPLRIVASMTMLTKLVVDFSDFRNLLGIFCQDFNDMPETLDHIGFMALMAIQFVHGTLIPSLVRGVHQVTGGAELWIVLGVIIYKHSWNGKRQCNN